jgi:hypothetical protein
MTANARSIHGFLDALRGSTTERILQRNRRPFVGSSSRPSASRQNLFNKYGRGSDSWRTCLGLKPLDELIEFIKRHFAKIERERKFLLNFSGPSFLCLSQRSAIEERQSNKTTSGLANRSRSKSQT